MTPGGGGGAAGRPVRRSSTGVSGRARSPRGGGRRLRGRSIIALVLLGFVLVATGVIWRRSYGFARQRELDALSRRLDQLRAQHARLESDIRDASSRSRLVPIVEQRLQMHLPNDTQAIILPRRTPNTPATRHDP